MHVLEANLFYSPFDELRCFTKSDFIVFSIHILSSENSFRVYRTVNLHKHKR